MKYDLKLRPIHYACVSGGKDSLYMFYYILNHLDKYPLDYVVHFELEIDYPFIKNVIDKIESICNQLNIPFMRIKPTNSFDYYYKKYGYPNRIARWCNKNYKLSCDKQFRDMVKSWNCRPVAYIGFCANETRRFKYILGHWKEEDICYPLAEENILEDSILEWAKEQDIYNNYYRFFTRCGCMGCPCSSLKEYTYLYIYYNEQYLKIMEMIKSTEERFKYKNYQYFYYPFEKAKWKIEHSYLRISL
jgi:3'-phosphoadenosine 5'-phosphosulfate sulfotransferase (PAPS reductase)/FAD synthetase